MFPRLPHDSRQKTWSCPESNWDLSEEGTALLPFSYSTAQIAPSIEGAVTTLCGVPTHVIKCGSAESDHFRTVPQRSLYFCEAFFDCRGIWTL